LLGLELVNVHEGLPSLVTQGFRLFDRMRRDCSNFAETRQSRQPGCRYPGAIQHTPRCQTTRTCIRLVVPSLTA
jgi:hypothetical protein